MDRRLFVFQRYFVAVSDFTIKNRVDLGRFDPLLARKVPKRVQAALFGMASCGLELNLLASNSRDFFDGQFPEGL